jgi:hypothetical protein
MIAGIQATSCQGVGTWYKTISEADRGFIDAVKEWLAPVPWQFFVTLEFTWNVGSETAKSKLKEHLAEIGKGMREPICFVGGMERKPGSQGASAPWHLHVLMTASGKIPENRLKELWWKKVGRGQRTLLHPEGESIDIKPFNDARLGLEYCLKFANDCHGDWFFRWLEIFNPNIPKSANHREVRRRTRGSAKIANVSG